MIPKISVIVVSYNSENIIEKTLQSVVGQTYSDFEIILVDRNSKDKTLEIAGKYKDKINKWISEPDKLPFDTLNKGVLLSRGEYILFLNSGDRLYSDDTLEKFSQYLNGTEIVKANVKLNDKIYKPKYNDTYDLIEGETFLASEFIKRELLEISGGFDTRFRILADKEFNLRAIFKEKVSLKYINETLTLITKKGNEIISPKKARRLQKEKSALRKLYYTKWQSIISHILFWKNF